MVRLVLFDIDGTLVRTGGAGVKAFGRVFETIFGAKDHFELLRFAGRTDFSLVREFFGYHGIPCSAENFEMFFDAYAFWLDHLLTQSKTAVCPGVREMLNALEKLPQPPITGLLTGNIRLGAEIKLRHFGLWDAFQTGAFADDHEDRNCIAAIAKDRGSRILRRQLKPQEVLVIGDTPLDVRCARAIGAQMLAVATGGPTLEELRAHKPDWAVPDLTQANPEEIFGASPKPTAG